MTVGKRIMKLRKELNMTQEELAKKMGYKSKSTINKIETGINDITQSKISKFADILNTTVSYLMGWDDEPEDVAAFEASVLSDDELMEMIKLFLSLNDEDKKVVRQMIERLST